MKTHLLVATAGLGIGIAASANHLDAEWIARLDMPQLQSIYLACDARATRERLDAASAQTCSIVHESLLRRGFDGDFARMLQWWRANRGEALVTTR